MEKDKYMEMLLRYNNHEINEKEFVDYLNSQEELQKIFNKALKSYLSSSDKSVVERINKDYAKIGTPQDRYSADTNESASKLSIRFYVKELIAKKYFQFLDKTDVNKVLVNAITDMSGLYSAEKQVEDFIKLKVLNNMPDFKSLSDAVKYAKTKVKELFVCENIMPKWAQNCEWPFDKNGNPLKFVSQKTTGEKVEYLFVDVFLKEVVVVQYY